jgi:hypothetical protein
MAIARVQAPAITASLANATTVTATFVSNVTAGNLLVASCTGTSGFTQTYSSTGSPVWVKTAQFTETGGSGGALSIGYCKNAPGGATTVTVTFSGSAGARALVIAEYSGADTTAPLDQSTAGLEIVTSATPTDTAMVTTVNGALIVAGLIFRNATSPASAGSGYSMIAVDQATGVGVDFGAEDRIQASAGSIAATFTLTAGTANSGIMSAAFKPAAVAAPIINLTMAPITGY